MINFLLQAKDAKDRVSFIDAEGIVQPSIVCGFLAYFIDHQELSLLYDATQVKEVFQLEDLLGSLLDLIRYPSVFPQFLNRAVVVGGSKIMNRLPADWREKFVDALAQHKERRKSFARHITDITKLPLDLSLLVLEYLY